MFLGYSTSRLFSICVLLVFIEQGSCSKPYLSDGIIEQLHRGSFRSLPVRFIHNHFLFGLNLMITTHGAKNEIMLSVVSNSEIQAGLKVRDR